MLDPREDISGNIVRDKEEYPMHTTRFGKDAPPLQSEAARAPEPFFCVAPVLRRVVSRLWNVLAVGKYGPFLQTVEFCASSPMTNAK